MRIKRVSICLYGLFNNRYSPTSGAEGFEEIKRIIDMNPEIEFQVFGYSTDLENEAEIRSLYGEINATLLFEEQQDFAAMVDDLEIDRGRFPPPEPSRKIENLFSFYYSRKRSIDLMLSQGGSRSDLVVISRFDSGQIDRFNGRQKDKVSSIGFNPYLRPEFVYSASWHQHNLAYADQWFITSPENAEILGTMFEESQRYLLDGSSYLNHVTAGITDSNAKDEFSNERFKPEKLKAKELAKVSEKFALNSHLFHKHFFLENGLYDISRFTNNFFDVPLVVFTHSEYVEIAEIFFKQIERHFDVFPKRYLLIDSVDSKMQSVAEQIQYDETRSYVDRLIHCLVQIDSEVIFFAHEDMFIDSQPSTRHILDAIEQIKSGKLDYFSFARGGMQIGVPILGLNGLRRYLNWLSPWIVSIQPGLWRRQALLDLLREHRGKSVWEFESAAQRTFRSLHLRGGFSAAKGAKRGALHWDNPKFPYIATAVVRGRLNWSEYPAELDILCREYRLDRHWKPQR